MRIAGILLLLFLPLCACTALHEHERSNALDYAINHYEQAIRWGDPAAAGKFRKAGDPAAAAALPDDPQIRVTGCEALQLTASADGNEVTVNTRITWYHADSMKVMTLTDMQHWQYDATQKNWYITSPPPDFGQ
jgi:hypothetical protein